MIHKLSILSIVLFSFIQAGLAQEMATTSPDFQIRKTYPYISITESKLSEVNTLLDLNSRYKTEWVKSYESVAITVSHNNSLITSLSKDDTLSYEQKKILFNADRDKDITVKIIYIPENTLTNNELKEENFSLRINPANDAQFIGGTTKLKNYLKENAIAKIPQDHFVGYDLSSIKFTIGKKGQILDVHSYGNEYKENKDNKIEALLIETISNMPTWQPASYADGSVTKQEFVFMTGNMESCVSNLLNIEEKMVSK